MKGKVAAGVPTRLSNDKPFFQKKTWAPLINLIVNYQHQTEHRHLNVHGWSLIDAPTVAHAVDSLTGDTMMLSRGNIIMVSGKVSHNPPQ